MTSDIGVGSRSSKPLTASAAWVAGLSITVALVGVLGAAAPVLALGLGVSACVLTVLVTQPKAAVPMLAVAVVFPLVLTVTLWKSYFVTLAWAVLPLMAVASGSLVWAGRRLRAAGPFDGYVMAWIVAATTALVGSALLYSPLSLGGLASYGRFVFVLAAFWYLRPFLAATGDRERLVRWVLVVAGLSAAIVVVIAVITGTTFVTGAGNRTILQGRVFGWPNGISLWYGSIALVGFAVGGRTRGWRRSGAWMVSLLCITLVLATTSRTGILGLVVGLISLAWLSTPHLSKRRRRWLVVIAVLGGTGLMLLPPVWNRLAATFISGARFGVDGATMIRILLVLDAISFLVEHPSVILVGAGFRNFGELVPSIDVQGFVVQSAHNQYLDSLMRGGMLNLVGYVLLLGRTLVVSRRVALDTDDGDVAATGAAVGAIAMSIVVTNMTQQNLFFEPMFVMFVTALVTLDCAARQVRAAPWRRGASGGPKHWPAVAEREG